jgi:hypothetical protein
LLCAGVPSGAGVAAGDTGTAAGDAGVRPGG